MTMLKLEWDSPFARWSLCDAQVAMTSAMVFPDGREISDDCIEFLYCHFHPVSSIPIWIYCFIVNSTVQVLLAHARDGHIATRWNTKKKFILLKRATWLI